jgi:FkbM family methyltransferase
LSPASPIGSVADARVSKLKEIAKHLVWSALRLTTGKSVVPLRVRAGPAAGAVLSLDLRSQAAYWVGNYDAYAFARLPFARYLKPGAVVWDCGAFVGYYAAVFRRLVGDRGQVIVFEASSANYTHLQRLPTLNRWTNVTIHHAAVGAAHTQLEFVAHLGAKSGPASFKRDLAGPGDPPVELVPCRGVDELVYELGVPAPAFIKFDLESAEEFALHNGPRTYREHRPVLLLELHGEAACRAAGRFLEDYRYVGTPVHELADLPSQGEQAWLASLRRHAVGSAAALQQLGYIPHMLLTLPAEHPDAPGAGLA